MTIKDINEELIIKMKEEGLQIVDDHGNVYEIKRAKGGWDYSCRHPGSGGSCSTWRWVSSAPKNIAACMKRDWKRKNPEEVNAISERIDSLQKQVKTDLWKEWFNLKTDILLYPKFLSTESYTDLCFAMDDEGVAEVEVDKMTEDWGKAIDEIKNILSEFGVKYGFGAD